MIRHYILDGKYPRAVPMLEWAKWLQEIGEGRVVRRTKLSGGIKVSTVFLGLDHRWDDQGPPLIFETMIFGGPRDQDQWRCSTWEQAERQHEEAVRLAMEGQPDDKGL
jgi:hypothetical protein